MAGIAAVEVGHRRHLPGFRRSIGRQQVQALGDEAGEGGAHRANLHRTGAAGQAGAAVQAAAACTCCASAGACGPKA